MRDCLSKQSVWQLARSGGVESENADNEENFTQNGGERQLEVFFTFSSCVLGVSPIGVDVYSIRNVQMRCNCQRQTPIRFCGEKSDIS